MNCETRALPGVFIFSTSLLSELIAEGDTSRCSKYGDIAGKVIDGCP